MSSTAAKPPAELFDLSGKIAVVTGASRGIGEATARQLAAAGAHVIVSSRKIDGCEAVAESIRETGGSAEAFACHIGGLDQIEALFAHVESAHGRLDILVNNAATNPHFGPIVDTPVSMYEKTVEVNIRGYFVMSQFGARMMAKNGSGAIVNVASINGVSPGLLQGIYSITKAAVISMTKAFAKECAGSGVRVNALLPGLTDTKFASALISNPQILEQAMKEVPIKRAAEPNEMAGSILFMVSDAGSYLTGAAINVDGGYLA